MGNWRIEIEGVGPHHGSDPVQHPDDAEKLAAAFVRELVAHGQRIARANFVKIEGDPRVEGLMPPAGDAMTLMDKAVAARMERRTAASRTNPASVDPESAGT